MFDWIYSVGLIGGLIGTYFLVHRYCESETAAATAKGRCLRASFRISRMLTAAGMGLMALTAVADPSVSVGTGALALVPAFFMGALMGIPFVGFYLYPSYLAEDRGGSFVMTLLVSLIFSPLLACLLVLLSNPTPTPAVSQLPA